MAETKFGYIVGSRLLDGKKPFLETLLDTLLDTCLHGAQRRPVEPYEIHSPPGDALWSLLEAFCLPLESGVALRDPTAPYGALWSLAQARKTSPSPMQH